MAVIGRGKSAELSNTLSRNVPRGRSSFEDTSEGGIVFQDEDDIDFYSFTTIPFALSFFVISTAAAVAASASSGSCLARLASLSVAWLG